MRKKLLVAQSRRSTLVVEVKLSDDGRLSISGAETTTNGADSGGQIVDHIEADAARIAAEPGGRRSMGEADLSALVEIWRRWHLNDMRPGCEHQTGPAWDTRREIEFHTFSIDWDDRRRIERGMERDRAALGSPAQAGGPLTPTAQTEFRRYSHAAALLFTLDAAGVHPFAWAAIKKSRALAALSQAFQIIGEHELAAYRQAVAHHAAGERFRWPGAAGLSAVPKPPVLKRTERKAAGWLRPTEHPDGLLMKPCQACGYEYGSKWRCEEIPAAVVAELERITGGRPEPPSDDEPYQRAGLALDVAPITARSDGGKDWAPGSRHFRCTLRRGKRSASFDFSQGSACTEPPTLAGVIECLRLDDSLLTDEDEAAACGLKPSQIRKGQRQAQQVRAVLGDCAEEFGFHGQGVSA